MITTTATMAASSLLSLPLLTIITLLHSHHGSTLASASTIQCHTGFANTRQTIPPSRINDGYCDCPFDGLDEPSTDACSGSMDGMWAGIPPKFDPSDYDAAHPARYFECPQQPSLKLPLSRVNDGICDCCDGADESSSTSTSPTTCSDICDQVLAEERAARTKATGDYIIGSQKRDASISQYQSWYAESALKLRQLKEVDLAAARLGQEHAEERLVQAKVDLANDWLRVVNEEVLGTESLMEVVGGGSMTLDDLASFIISLCWLSAEADSRSFANERCVALDRASLDLGILWNYASSNVSDSLPSFAYLDSGAEDALVDYAEKILLRLEGKDTINDHTPNKNTQRRNKHRREPDDSSSDDSSGDDPYGDDWEDNHGYDDDFVGGSDHDYEEQTDPSSSNGEEGAENEKAVQLSKAEKIVKSLVDKVPVDRSLFKEQSKILLKYANDAAEKEAEESSTDGEVADENNEEEETPGVGSGVDPMALQMVKSTITKNLSNILRGETSAKSAAKFAASLMEDSDSPLGEMKNLAIMTMYHSNMSAEEMAELVYSISSILRSSDEGALEGDNNESSCSAPWSSMCPPSTVQLPNGGKSYPPSVIVEAATSRCEQRENSVGVCTVQDEDEFEFPVSIPDGYYNYFSPQSRDEDERLALYFSSVDSLHEVVPANIVNLRKQKGDLDRKNNSISKSISDLEGETGGDTPGSGTKYGVDGELYIMRDLCYTLESGKYEYEVCVFGKAAQRDAGQKSGGTNLGSWDNEHMDEDGQRTLKWGGGTKCWNGPVRSAEVVVTCGAETKLLTADEPETCKYVFTMESPIGCDEQFKVKNAL